MEKSIKILVGINIGTYILVLIFLFFVSTFWLGSKEQHDKLLLENSTSFILARLTINLIVCSLGMIFISLINVLCKKLLNIKNYNTRKIIFIEILLLFVNSIIFIFIQL